MVRKYIIAAVWIIVVIFVFLIWINNINKPTHTTDNEIAHINNFNTLVYSNNTVTNITEYINDNSTSNTTSTLNSDIMDYTEDEISSYYERTVGVNGTVNYKCTRVCDENCYKCEKCIRNAQSFNRKPKCNFSYQIPKKARDIGWIGCPQCGDITYEEWWEFYDPDNF